LGVLDEYRYPRKLGLDLKLFEGQPLKVDKKYSHHEDLKDLKITTP
jgi:hypothetical protein